MHNREKRLAWIESLFKEPVDYDANPQQRFLVVDYDGYEVALPFSAIKQVLPGTRLQTIPFLPDVYCGVVDFDMDLYPVLGTHVADRMEKAKIALIVGTACSFGICFHHMPDVLDRESAHIRRPGAHDAPLPRPLVTKELMDIQGHIVPLLDIEATAQALLVL